MQDNILTIIGTLKAETIGRCRERIDLASKKAQEIVGKGQPACRAGSQAQEVERHGVTEIIKRRHGL